MPDSTWSTDARVLFEPARVFREAARDARGRGAWMRRPLGLLLAFGCCVSILASGRFNVRLILDGAMSFAFVVAIEIAVLALIMRGGLRPSGARRPMSFAREVDIFFIGNAPWLLWLVIVGAVFGVVAPRENIEWLNPAIYGCVIPGLWSAWIDFYYFREFLPASPGRAGFAVVLSRAIGWSAGVGIFLGIAIWSEYMPRLAAWMAR